MILEHLPAIRSRCFSRANCHRATGEDTSPRLALVGYRQMRKRPKGRNAVLPEPYGYAALAAGAALAARAALSGRRDFTTTQQVGVSEVLHEVEKELASLQTPQTHFLGETCRTLDRPRLHVQVLVDHAPDGQFLTVA